MKRRHTLWPRRKKALVWGGIAAVLFLLLLLTHKVCLTPTQAIRAAEAETGTGKTEIVMTYSYEDASLYLTRNDKAMLLVPFSRKIDNGENRYLTMVDCTLTPGQVQAGGAILNDLSDLDNPRHIFLLFGYTDLPGAVSIEAHDTVSPDFDDHIPTEITASVTQSGPEKGYFWGTLAMSFDDTCVAPTALNVLDANGSVLATYDTSAYWGGATYDP